MFITPIFEIKVAPDDKFLSLAYDAEGKAVDYRYKSNDPKIKKAAFPKKAFEEIVLATNDLGEIIVMDKKGKITKRDRPLGI